MTVVDERHGLVRERGGDDGAVSPVVAAVRDVQAFSTWLADIGVIAATAQRLVEALLLIEDLVARRNGGRQAILNCPGDEIDARCASIRADASFDEWDAEESYLLTQALGAYARFVRETRGTHEGCCTETRAPVSEPDNSSGVDVSMESGDARADKVDSSCGDEATGADAASAHATQAVSARELALSQIPRLNHKPLTIDTYLDHLERQGVPFVDMRPFGGYLWVIADDDSSGVIEDARNQSIRMVFREKGGTSTNKLPAYVTRAQTFGFKPSLCKGRTGPAYEEDSEPPFRGLRHASTRVVMPEELGAMGFSNWIILEHCGWRIAESAIEALETIEDLVEQDRGERPHLYGCPAEEIAYRVGMIERCPSFRKEDEARKGFLTRTLVAFAKYVYGLEGNPEPMTSMSFLRPSRYAVATKRIFEGEEETPEKLLGHRHDGGLEKGRSSHGVLRSTGGSSCDLTGNPSEPGVSVAPVAETDDDEELLHAIRLLLTGMEECYPVFLLQALMRVAVEGSDTISYRELAARMVAAAWYPWRVRRLRFSSRDSLAHTMSRLGSCLGDDGRYDEHERLVRLMSIMRCLAIGYEVKEGAGVRHRADKLEEKVIFCIWDLDIEERDRPSFEPDAEGVMLGPRWASFFRKRHQFLQELLDAHLLTYLAEENPGVAGIASRLREECDDRA